MQYFVLAVALIAGLLLLARFFAAANPKLLASMLRLVGGLLLAVVPVALIATGQMQLILFALPFALPFYFHWRSNRLRRRNARGPAPGATSRVDTGWLRMELDHDSGAMDGTVQRGRFAGRELAGMTVEELRDLLDEVAADPDSVRVLEAYLDRVHGPSWRAGATDGGGPSGGGRTAASGATSDEEAYEILGLAPGAGAEEIREAHRRLMAKLHPDRGGSTYLAAKLNQAKDRLLKGR